MIDSEDLREQCWNCGRWYRVNWLILDLMMQTRCPHCGEHNPKEVYPKGSPNVSILATSRGSSLKLELGNKEER